MPGVPYHLPPRPKVGVLVGHYGKGTGARVGSRDEWAACYAEAALLVHELEEEGQLEPILIVLDRDRLPGLSWGRLADCKLRAFLAIVNEVEVAIELHLNRSTLNTLLRRPVAGHEVWIKRRPGPKTRRLGEALATRFSEELGNRDRGLRQKGFRVLEMLHKADIPAAILEPAFLSEDRAVSLEWRQGYRKATRRALYDYFTIDQEV